MAYFIHNKYDSNSSAKVTHVSGTSYTYKEDPGVTVIDFFGNMEAGVNTYRNLDTTYMGIKPVDELTHTTIDEDSLIGNGQTTDGASNLEYATGILPIVEKLQEITGQASDTGGSESVGTIMAKLNAVIASLSGGIHVIKRIQRGVVQTVKGNNQIKLTAVQPDKCLVILNSEYGAYSATGGSTHYGGETYNSILVQLQTNQLTISQNSYYIASTSSSARGTEYGRTSWQVIEFY